jgi:two-component system, cell cycle sensor histidine kinase and response regulator CckA
MLRVLVVDDDAVVRDVISAHLEASGYDVLTASNGLEAVQVFQSCLNLIDLVLIDLIMPIMSGHEAARLIWSAKPDAKVICMSGYSDAPPPGEAVFLAKPFKFDALERAIVQAIASPLSVRATAESLEIAKDPAS